MFLYEPLRLEKTDFRLPDRIIDLECNIVLHTFGRTGSHYLQQLVLENNSNIVSHYQDVPIFEYFHPGLNRELKTDMLERINAENKYWMIKSFCECCFMQLYKIPNTCSVYLYRRTLSDIARSFLTAMITTQWRYKVGEEIPKFNYSKADILSACCTVFNRVIRTLELQYNESQKFGIQSTTIVYEDLCSDPAAYFNNVSVYMKKTPYTSDVLLDDCKECITDLDLEMLNNFANKFNPSVGFIR